MPRYQSRAFRQLVGERLRETRLSKGLTQEELAWEAGIAQGSISHYEQGRNEIPVAVLIALCRAMRVPPVQIVPGLEPTEFGLDPPSSMSARPRAEEPRA